MPSLSSIQPKFVLKGMFLHAWDFLDDGIDFVLDEIQKAGLNTLCLAGTYHSGWFVHPHNSRHRAFMTEGSVCYFHPRVALYEKTRLRLQVSKIARERDWFAEVSKQRDDLRLVSWTVGTHNTRLGLEHPELTQQNVYGDRLPHALCPAQPEVRQYLHALCHDLATQYDLWAIQLEAFGWMGFVHGHHHERDLTGLTSLESELMGWCVCPACKDLATAAGVEIEPLEIAVKHVLDGAFREAPDRPLHHPTSMEEFEAASPEVKKFRAWRKNYADSIIRDIKQNTLRGTNCRVLLETEYDAALEGVVDGFACAAYQQTPEQTLETCRKSSAGVPAGWAGVNQCLIQLGMGVPRSEEQLRKIIAAVGAGGCNGISFYNRSESPPKMLAWMARTMAALS